LDCPGSEHDSKRTADTEGLQSESDERDPVWNKGRQLHLGFCN